MSTARYRSAEISVPVDDVDVSLEEFETKDLIAELKHRHAMEAEKETPLLDDLSEVHAKLRFGQYADAIVLLEKILWPKWRTIDQCADALAKARKS